MFAGHIKHPDYGQHDQRDANLTFPEWQLSAGMVMGVVHDSNLRVVRGDIVWHSEIDRLC